MANNSVSKVGLRHESVETHKADQLLVGERASNHLVRAAALLINDHVASQSLSSANLYRFSLSVSTYTLAIGESFSEETSRTIARAAIFLAWCRFTEGSLPASDLPEALLQPGLLEASFTEPSDVQGRVVSGLDKLDFMDMTMSLSRLRASS